MTNDPPEPPHLPKLQAALKALPRPAIPASVDQAIAHATAAHFQQLQTRRRRLKRWLVQLPILACLLLAVWVFNPWRTQPDPTLARQDLNRDGHLDILDAFALARQVRDGQTTSQLDVTGDGTVNESDVNTLAQLVVQLPSRL